MAASCRDEAEALALGLETGMIDVEDVVAWADARVARLDAPPWATLDLAAMRDRHCDEVVRALRSLPGIAHRGNARSLLLQLITRRLPEVVSPHRLALDLFGSRDEAGAALAPDRVDFDDMQAEELREALGRASLAAASHGPRWAADWRPGA